MKDESDERAGEEETTLLNRGEGSPPVEPWRVRLFGDLQVTRGEVTIQRFRTRKADALLAYLAFYRHRAHSRERLADMLWPDSDTETGLGNLRSELSRLRKLLELPGVAGSDRSSPPFFLLNRETVQVNPTSLLTDIEAFEAELKAAQRSSAPEERIERLQAAAELYRGDLWPAGSEDWLIGERQRLGDLYFPAVLTLMRLLDERGRVEDAVQCALNAIQIDPLREEIHEALIRLHAAQGQPTAAQRQYRELERILDQILGTRPSEEIAAVVQACENRCRKSGLSAASGSETPDPIATSLAEEGATIAASPGEEPWVSPASPVASEAAGDERSAVGEEDRGVSLPSPGSEANPSPGAFPPTEISDGSEKPGEAISPKSPVRPHPRTQRSIGTRIGFALPVGLALLGMLFRIGSFFSTGRAQNEASVVSLQSMFPAPPSPVSGVPSGGLNPPTAHPDPHETHPAAKTDPSEMPSSTHPDSPRMRPTVKPDPREMRPLADLDARKTQPAADRSEARERPKPAPSDAPGDPPGTGSPLHGRRESAVRIASRASHPTSVQFADARADGPILSPAAMMQGGGSKTARNVPDAAEMPNGANGPISPAESPADPPVDPKPAASSTGCCWKELPAIQTPRSELSAVRGPDGRIYVFGGASPYPHAVNSVEAYDQKTKKWASFPSMKHFHYAGAAAVSGGSLYVLGGKEYDANVGLGGPPQSYVERFDPRVGQWEDVEPMGLARYDLTAVADRNGTIYAIGGQGDEQAFNRVEALTPGKGWCMIAPMHEARDEPSAVLGADGRIYVIGGADVEGNALSSVEMYDPLSNTWSYTTSLPEGRYGAAAVTGPDGKIYVVGGKMGKAGHQQPMNSVEVYDLRSRRWSSLPSLPTNPNDGISSLAAVNGGDGYLYVLGGCRHDNSLIDVPLAASFSDLEKQPDRRVDPH